MAVRQPIGVIPNVAASFLEHLHSSPVLLSIDEIALVVITFVCRQLAVPFGSVVEPHAREAELRAADLPLSDPMLHALVPLPLERFTSCDFV